MHGPIWLENPIISLVLLATGFYMLYGALITENIIVSLNIAIAVIV
jgi:hypothetical protein